MIVAFETVDISFQASIYSTSNHQSKGSDLKQMARNS